MGGEQALLALMLELAEQNEVTAVYRKTEPPDRNGSIRLLFEPNKAITLETVADHSPDVLIVDYRHWAAMADAPCRKLAYVCYWRERYCILRNEILWYWQIVYGC